MFKFKKIFKFKKKKKKTPIHLYGKWNNLTVQDTFVRKIKKKDDNIVFKEEEINDIIDNLDFNSQSSMRSLSSNTIKQMEDDYKTILYNEIIDSIVIK